METEKELNDKILSLTREIREKYPELSRYLDEMPLTIPNDSQPEVTINKLKEYYESLKLLIQEHT
jgi:hypothetical protein